ncbi:hypothetical protein [uncultured Methylobacterium sp.]|uniref:hypothetical protein n=1 Tax=uncultured Methylobacterium sp. TaxID=157278 RepID=UPI0035CB7579
MVPFTFGIALVPRRLARDWGLIEALLDLTLGSVLAQTDPDFRVILAGHDRPRTVMDGDPRLTFLEADWPVADTGPHNDDSGRKKHALNDRVLTRGGGLLMLLDADDWVDRRLVAAARAGIGPDVVGGLIEAGCVTDFQSLRTAPLPHPDIFADAFHRVCGSSTVALLRPGETDALRRDPFSVLRSHHRWVEVAREHGVRLARLPVSGNYLVNTSENHSDLHGPHLAWRQAFIAAVDRNGRDLDGVLAARFGLDLAGVRSASRRFFPNASRRWD